MSLHDLLLNFVAALKLNRIPFACFMCLYLEHRILKKKSERDKVYGFSNNRDELKKNLIARMESLTHASEDVCVSILERNSYDLETSVEAYLSDSRQHNNFLE